MAARVEPDAAPERAERPPLLLRGVDSLYVSYFLDPRGLDFEDLAYRKEKLRATRDREHEAVEIGGERLALMPFGRKPYSYVLQNRAFTLMLAERMQPSCHVQFSSEALWSQGVEGALRRFEAWARAAGLVAIRPETVSRCDWAFDYALPAVDFDEGQFVTRANKDATHREHRIAQTFRFGQGDIVVRIYDKCAEIEQQSGKAWFYELWGQKAGVWRIEFQVRGERLREAGIKSLDDLRSLQNDLLRELAANHTTLREPNGDTNRSRWPLHPLWRALQADIAALPQTGLVKHVDPDAALPWRLERALRSLYGHMKGTAALDCLARGRGEPLSFAEFVARIVPLMARLHAEDLWRNDLAKRIDGYWLGTW